MSALARDPRAVASAAGLCMLTTCSLSASFRVLKNLSPLCLSETHRLRNLLGRLKPSDVRLSPYYVLAERYKPVSWRGPLTPFPRFFAFLRISSHAEL